MKIADEIIGVLGRLRNASNPHDSVCATDDYAKREEEVIDQALKEILKLKVKLPEKKETNIRGDENCMRNAMYNQALEDVTKLNEE